MGTSKQKITVINAAFFGNERQIDRIVDQTPYDNVEYVMYTNQPNKAQDTIWDVKEVKIENMGLRMAARQVKTQPHIYHPDSDYWLWIDASMKINIDPNTLVEKYLSRFDICAMPHPERNNWWEEANAILGYRMDTKENVQRGIDKYLDEGLAPTQLWETGCLLRRNTSKVIDFNNIWWNEIQTNSIRDQISVQYASWKSGAHINSFPGTNSRNALRFKNKPYLPQWNEITRAW